MKLNPFKKDKKPAPAAGAGAPPTEKVVQLSSKGYSEPEIIKTLRDQGHSPLEVDRALKEALRRGTTPSAPQPAAPGGYQPPAPPQPRAPQPGPQPLPPTGTPEPQRPQAPPAPGAPPEPGPFPPEPSMEPAPRPEPPGQPFAPPAPDMPGFPEEGDKFAPTAWDTGNDMDESPGKPPEHARMGVDDLMERIDKPLPGPPPALEGEEKEPLAFPGPPSSKDRKQRQIEEMVEQITEEKWKSAGGRIGKLEERLDDLAQAKETPSAAGGPSPAELPELKKQIAEQKQGIEETNARIDSLEEVVKSSLTPMLESLRKFTKNVSVRTELPAAEKKK